MGKEATVPSGGRAGEVAPGCTCVGALAKKEKEISCQGRGVSVCLDLITALHLPR